MAIDPNAVGQKGQPSNRSWNSKDALLYAVGIGAGIDELQYTTENTKDVVQKVFLLFKYSNGITNNNHHFVQ